MTGRPFVRRPRPVRPREAWATIDVLIVLFVVAVYYALTLVSWP